MGKFNRKIATLLACVSGLSSIVVSFNSMAMNEGEKLIIEDKQQGEKYSLFGEKEYRSLREFFSLKDYKNTEDLLKGESFFSVDDGRIVYSWNMMEWETWADNFSSTKCYKLIVNGKKSPVYDKFQRHPVLVKIDELTGKGYKVYKLPVDNGEKVELFVYVDGGLYRLRFDSRNNSVSCQPWKSKEQLRPRQAYKFQADLFPNVEEVRDTQEMLQKIYTPKKYIDYLVENPKMTAESLLLALSGVMAVSKVLN